MNTAFRSSFASDLKKVKDRRTLNDVKRIIEIVENADSLAEISSVKKLRGRGNFYRIRIGDYRIGIAVEGEIVEFVRCLPRRDIYRYFP